MTARGAKQRAAFCQLAALARSETKVIMSLATKLRITNSAHRDSRYDERRVNTLPEGRRPWEVT
jgi:hypothetical protein